MDHALVRELIARHEPRIESILSAQRVVGAALGVVCAGELAWFRPWGHADPARGRPADERTLFPIASNTKPFTATAVMQLRDAGKLALDDPLVGHVPEIERAAVHHGSLRDVTLRRLLTHTSGLRGELPGNRFDTGIGPSVPQLLERLDEVAVVVPPGAMHKYCNLGFALLGVVVERRSGVPYDEYVRRAILEPLGMRDSTFTPEGGTAPRAVPSRHEAEEVSPRPALQMQHHAAAAAGGLRSSVADMARWLAHACALGRGEARTPSVLAPATLQEMLRPHARMTGWQQWQCLGWNVRVVRERPLYGHGGSLPGALSQAHFSPAHDLGVIALTNSDAHTAAEEVATSLLDALVEAHEQDADRRPVDLSPAPAAFAPYLGRYVARLNNLGAVMRIAWGDGRLMLLAEDGAPPRRYEATGMRPAPARLELVERGVLRPVEGRWAGEPLRFRFAEGGEAVTGFDSPSGTFMARLVPADTSAW